MISCILAVPCGHLKLTEENGFITACDWTEEAPFFAETALLKKQKRNWRNTSREKGRPSTFPCSPKELPLRRTCGAYLKRFLTDIS